MSDFFYTMTELCPVIVGQSWQVKRLRDFFKLADLQPVCVCVCRHACVCVCNLKNNVHILQVVEEN